MSAPAALAVAKLGWPERKKVQSIDMDSIQLNVGYIYIYLYIYVYVYGSCYRFINRIGGVMISAIASSVVDRGFEP